MDAVGSVEDVDTEEEVLAGTTAEELALVEVDGAATVVEWTVEVALAVVAAAWRVAEVWLAEVRAGSPAVTVT